MLILLALLAVLVSGMNRLMLRKPLGLLLMGPWNAAGGAGTSARGVRRVGLGFSGSGRG